MTDPFGCGDDAPAIASAGTEHFCADTLESCPGGFPAAQSCVTQYCQLGCLDTNGCCSSSNPQSCFESSGTGSGSGAAASSSSLPPGAAACTSLANLVDSCESSTSGFSTLPNTQQASCICFNQDGSYNGTVWDMAASTCYQAMQSESQSASVLSAYESQVVGACTKFVDAGVLSSASVGNGAAATTTAGSTSKAAVVAAKTTAATTGAQAKASTSTSAGPTTATAKSDAVRKGHDMRAGWSLSGVCMFVGFFMS